MFPGFVGKLPDSVRVPGYCDSNVLLVIGLIVVYAVFFVLINAIVTWRPK
jgi:hypothetical protein